MNVKVEGIVLSNTDYGESSKILNVLTDKYGLIGIIAKGAKRTKSSIKCGVSLLTMATFTIYYKENHLSILKSIDRIENMSNLKKDLAGIAYLNYICDLSYQVSKQTGEKIFPLLKSAIKKMENKTSYLPIKNILEIKLLSFLGISLCLNSCVICGKKENIVTISLTDGGFICDSCVGNKYIFDNEILKILYYYYICNITDVDVSNYGLNSLKQVNKIISEYYDDYSGLYLKSKKFLETVN